MEAANDRATLVPQGPSQIVRLEDKVTGAADRAEQGQKLVCENVWVPQYCKFSARVVSQVAVERRWKGYRVLVKYGNSYFGCGFGLHPQTFFIFIPLLT